MFNSKRSVLFVFLLAFFAGLVTAETITNNEGKNKIRKDALSVTKKVRSPSGNVIFQVYSPIHNLPDFRAFADQIARLNSFGRIDMVINFTAEKADFEMPEGGSPWHEYTAYDRSLSKFFPDKKIAPFIPEELVKKNRQLLMSKVSILRDIGMSAQYKCNEP